MIPAHRKLIDQAIQRHGDDWWNFDIDEDLPEEDQCTNREWVVEELINLLAEDNLTLEVIRTNR